MSKTKDSETMKFGQLIEYNMRNIFLEKPCTKCGGETSKTFFEKIKNEHISGTITWSFTQFFFIGCQVEGYGNILKLSCRPLAFTSCDAFFKTKTKRGLELVSVFSIWSTSED